MAAQNPQGHHESETAKVAEETTGCGMFDFLKKKGEEEKPTLKEKFHRSHSSSSSSSDEEEGGEKKKKKGLKLKLKEKISGNKGEEDNEPKDMSIPVENHDQIASGEEAHPDEKKGILEKIKEKLPGQHKKAAEEDAPDAGHSPEGEPKEKKGILEKIKEKLPGCHKNEGEGKED